MPPGTAGTHPVPLILENRQFLGNYLGPPYPQIHSKFSFLGNFVEKDKKIIKFREIPTKFHQNGSKNDGFDQNLGKFAENSVKNVKKFDEFLLKF